MNASAGQSGHFFVSGGSLPPGVRSYIERPADGKFLDRLSAGEFCYVLTARQMGKSSLMARTAVKLRAAGILTAIIDLTSIGEGSKEHPFASTWGLGVARAIASELGLKADLKNWWQERDGLPEQQRFTEFLEQFVLGATAQRIVICVDEIDRTLSLPFTDDFFAGIRACYNARATKPIFARLTFALLGVASPSELIKDAGRTPFNIGQRIQLDGFTLDEAGPLAEGLPLEGMAARQAIGRVLYWTGGQPYLTQKVCLELSRRLVAVERFDLVGPSETPPGLGVRQTSAALAPDGLGEERQGPAALQTAGKPSLAPTDVAQRVDQLVEQLLLSPQGLRDELHFRYIRQRVLQDPRRREVLRTYRRVLRGEPVPDNPQSFAQNALTLAGLLRRLPEGVLCLSNRVYERVFGPEWVAKAMAADPTRRRAFALGVAAILLVVLPVGLWLGGRSETARVKALAQALLEARPDAVPGALTRLEPLPRLALPQLLAEFTNASPSSPDALQAALGLAAFGDIQVAFLLDRAAEGPDGQCMNLVRALAGARTQAISEIPQRIANAESPEARARLATLAMFLGDLAPAQGLTRRDPNPTNRTAFIQGYRQWSGEPLQLAGMLRTEATDMVATNLVQADFRSALCAALSLIQWTTLAASEQEALREAVQRLYAGAPDGGTRSAALCALTRWGQPLPESPPPTNHPPPGREWFVNRSGMTMILLPAGSFRMGDPEGDDDEKPPHEVNLSKSFFISDREVTVAMFRQFTNRVAGDTNTPPFERITNWRGEDREVSPAADCPVQSVSWLDAVRFCNWLSRLERRTPCYSFSNPTNCSVNFEADGYRLPTEAEWEYACRAVSQSDFTFGDDGRLSGEYSWYEANSSNRTWPAGAKLPSLWGVFDMHGNVWEWCQDWYAADYYQRSPKVDPPGPESGIARVLRGGSWYNYADLARCAFRNRYDPGDRDGDIGFHLVSSPFSALSSEPSDL